MASSLSVKWTNSLKWEMTNALDLSTPNDYGTLDLKDDLANGTGTDQADEVWHDERTLAAASETLDLTSLAGGPWGSTKAFASIKAIFIKNTGTTTGEDLTVGGAAANAWCAMFADSTDKAKVMPNGVLAWWSPTDAETVDGTHKNLKIDAGAASITYKIVIVGVST